MDKAPDAFRTISEVAEELDIPQHVLRFWETRFAQIKPMKRSGGRRYYRPDDVDLLKGIRRLLYGEGYTIRGVQRILKEHGIKSVQGLRRPDFRRHVRRGRGGRSVSACRSPRRARRRPSMPTTRITRPKQKGNRLPLCRYRRGRHFAAVRQGAKPGPRRPIAPTASVCERVLQDLDRLPAIAG